MTNVLAVAAILLQAAPAVGDVESAEECALSIVASHHEAFRQANADALAELFVEDASWFNAFGDQRQGRAAIREVWEGLLTSGTFSAAAVNILGTTSYVLSPSMVVIDQTEELVGQRTPGVVGRQLPDRYVHATFIIQQHGGSCLITYYRAGDLHNYPRWTPPANVPTDVLAAYEGLYVSELRGDTVTIRLEDESLLAVWEDGDADELIPVSEARFRLRDLFEFIRDAAGAVTGFRIYQATGQEVFVRLIR